MSDDRKVFGDEGEEEARRFLEKKGYTFVEANFRARSGEIDLIFKDKQTWVFVEVKRRTGDRFGAPEEAITQTKKDHMVKAALSYIQDVGLSDQNIRFDVVSLGPLGLRHYRSAFLAGSDYYY